MKKILAIIFILLMSVSLFACGGTSTAPPSKEPPSASASVEPSVAPSVEPSTDMSNQVGSGVIGDYAVTIIDFAMAKDYEDRPTIIVNYEWTNNGEKATSFMIAVNSKAFQSGVECETAIILGDSFSSDAMMKDIKPGVTFKVQCAYVLNDDSSPVEIELKELFSFASSPPMITKTFEIA